MVINPRIGRCLNQTIIGYRTVEQTPWDRLPIGLRIYSKGLSVLSDRHLTISTQRDGCKQARAAPYPRTDPGEGEGARDCAGIYDTTLSATLSLTKFIKFVRKRAREVYSHTRNSSFNLRPANASGVVFGNVNISRLTVTLIASVYHCIEMQLGTL